MRILMVGAGGVGSSAAQIAARRDFFEALVVADYDPARAAGGRSPGRRPVRRRAGRRVRRPRRRARSRASTASTHVINAVDPRFVLPIFEGAFAAGARLPRHGDVPVAPAPGAAVRADRRQARRRPVRAGGTSGSRPAGSPSSAWASSPASSDVFARYAADHLFSEIDELGVRDGANLAGRRLRLRAVLLDLDHDRGVPQPAGDLGEGPRLVHHGAVQRAGDRSTSPRASAPVECVNVEHEEVLLMPRWVDARRVDVQVRPRRRVHRRAQDPAQARPGPHRAGVGRAASRCPRATSWLRALPDPPRSGRPDARQDLRRDLGHRHRARTAGRARCTCTTSSTTPGRWRSTARRPWSGRPRSTRSSRSSCSPTGAWSGVGVLGPEAFDAGAVPRPAARRVRLSRGGCRSAPRSGT